MKTIQQDLESLNLSLDEAIDVAQNRPVWRLMSTFGATHSYWCMPEMNEWMIRPIDVLTGRTCNIITLRKRRE